MGLDRIVGRGPMQCQTLFRLRFWCLNCAQEVSANTWIDDSAMLSDPRYEEIIVSNMIEQMGVTPVRWPDHVFCRRCWGLIKSAVQQRDVESLLDLTHMAHKLGRKDA